MNTIILTRIFPNSTYLQEGNMGHEIINLFKSDNGNNYIYLMPGGYYDKRYSNYDIDAVLIVRGINKNRVEVIAKATGLKPIFKLPKGWSGAKSKTFNSMVQIYNTGNYSNVDQNIINKINNFSAIHQTQIKYIEDNNIAYGNVHLDKLFEKSTTDSSLSIFITYKADRVVMVKEPFYLYISGESAITNNDIEVKSKGRLSGSALTTYYDDNDSDYKALQGILNKHDLWGSETKKYSPKNISADSFTFLNLIKKQYDELAYSNMFAYYFEKYPELLKYFLENVEDSNGKKLNNVFSKAYSVFREKENIDILIKFDSAVVIIENKIKSGINGKKHDINGKIVHDQLKKYYEYVKKEYNIEPLSIVFSPNYNNIDINKLTKQAGDYKTIKYSEIYEIFEKFYEKNKCKFKKDKYFKDFLAAIKYHSVDNDNRFEEISRRKLQQLIEKSK